MSDADATMDDVILAWVAFNTEHGKSPTVEEADAYRREFREILRNWLADQLDSLAYEADWTHNPVTYLKQYAHKLRTGQATS
ncbi:hypothetical protein [Kribbella sp. NPDC050470]|uniref:hypothetical protein n=1 Tax=unclassified Kribbella TaxID=2644121 RepID=UPI0037AFAE08